MRYFLKNRRGVSNIIGYMFSFAVASMVMVSAVFITMSIVDDKTSQVARIEAQNIANYLGTTVAEMVAMKEANPNAEYSKTLDIPLDLAGKSYYVEITENRIYVNTTDGRVSASCTTYHADELNIGAYGKISSGGGQATLSSSSGEYVYKLDFGTGNNASHSPVESGYYRVGTDELIGGGWSTSSMPDTVINSPYRVPIRVYNPSNKSLVDMPIKIILNTSNFDYDDAVVLPYGELSTYGEGGPQGDIIQATNVMTNLHFYDLDPANEISLDVSIDEDRWYPHWNWSTDEVVTVSIDPTYPAGMPPSYINGDTLKLGSIQGLEAECQSYSYTTGGDTGYAVFDREEAFKSLGIPAESISEGTYTLAVKGEFLDGTEFNEPISINMIYGEYYVSHAFGPYTNGWGDDHFDSINWALNKADEYETIYVYGGVVPYDYYEERITITDDYINLTGQNKDLVKIYAINDSEGSAVTVNGWNHVKITSFSIFGGGLTDGSDLYENGSGILLDSCTDVQIANCNVYNNNGDGIRLIEHSNNNTIRDCESHHNYGVYVGGSTYRGYGDGIEIDNSEYNRVIDCKLHNNSNSDTSTNPNGKGVRIDNGAHNNRIEGCIICDNKGVNGDGIQIITEEGTGQSTRNNIVADCVIYGHTGGSGDGIEITADDINSNKWPTNNKITNCTIFNNKGPSNGGVTIWKAQHSSINNSVLYENGVNIWLRYSEHSKIESCTITGAEDLVYSEWPAQGTGIKLGGLVNDTSIVNCYIGGNDFHGIYIEDELTNPQYLSGNTTIRNCRICDNGVDGFGKGILMVRTSNNLVDNCSIYHNADQGITIAGAGAWYLLIGARNIIQHCNIYGNSKTGLVLTAVTDPIYSAAFGNIIRYNNFYNNSGKGVWIEGVTADPEILSTSICRNNSIYGNNFIGNEGGNAKDDYDPDLFDYWYGHGYEYRNRWDNSKIIDVNQQYATIGNYWSDIDDHLYHENYPCDGSADAVYEVPGDYLWEDTFLISEDWEPCGPVNVSAGDCPSWDEDRAKMFGNPSEIYANIGGPSYDQWYKTDSIQEAINRSTPGGTVYIKNEGLGYYDAGSTIIVNKSIRLVGTNMPKIQNSGGGPVFDVENMSKTGDFSYDVVEQKESDLGIYFDSLVIGSGIGRNDVGIYVSDEYSCPGGGCQIPQSQNLRYVNILNCDFSNNVNGISINGWFVSVTNCTFYGSVDAHINISDSGRNLIRDCTFNKGVVYKTQCKDAINITNCQITGENNKNNITGCSINNTNANGINIINSDYSNIYRCKIYNSGNNGIYIRDTSENNSIINCNIKDNEFGVRIVGSINNDIYLNHFENENNSRSDSSPNAWDNGTAGNYWSDYDGLDNNYDGVGDVPAFYSIPGGGSNQDNCPLGVSWRVLAEVRDYSVDYWNPYGESIILLNLNMNAYEEKTIYLYYGNPSVLEPHMFSDTSTSEFFSNFNSKVGWPYRSGNPYFKNGVVLINESGYILSSYIISDPGSPKNVKNSETSNETLYVIEARVKLSTVLQETQGNLILLNQNPSNIDNCYLVSNHVVPGSGSYLKLYKQNGASKPYMDNTTLPSLLDHWQRITAYVYVGNHLYNVGGSTKITNASKISVNLYDFTSYNLEGSVSDTDGAISATEDAPGESDGVPYMSGRIGLGCGLNGSDVSEGSFIVDWIRIRKAPVVQPTVSIGAPEGRYYGWQSVNNIFSRDKSSDDPYKPGPLLRDFHEGEQTQNFIIRNLPSGTYTITVTSGNYDEKCNGTNITINAISNQSISTLGTLHFGSSLAGEFNSKSVTIHKTTGNNTDLILMFSKRGPGESAGLAKGWVVNAITIERGIKGMKLS